MAKATHVFIAGGVSVNDAKHDKYPYNFLNPAVWRAIAYKEKGKVDKAQLLVLVYTPSYEARVKDQKVEHPTVTGNTGKDPAYFWGIVKASALKHGFKCQEIKSAKDLTKALQDLDLIGSVQYFGHANPQEMFLEYSLDGLGRGTVTWGADQAKEVKPSKFAPNAVFMTFGCYQGEKGGLAEAVRKTWKTRTVGSISFTHYDTIGKNKPFPRSEKDDYLAFPPPTASDAAPKAVNVTKDLHGVKERFDLSAEELAAIK
jgi:hypothetical protein